MKGNFPIKRKLSLLILAILPILGWAQQLDNATAAATTAPDDTDALPLLANSPGDLSHGELWMKLGDGNRTVFNVTQPTLTPVLPDPEMATGAAVIVVPGGGFMALAMDLEGFKVARVLADHGIAAFVLKYRLHQVPVGLAERGQYIQNRLMKALESPEGAWGLKEPLAVEDALAALRLVREHSQQWGINAGRVGIMGFSAGAITSLGAVLDAAPGQGPDFVGYIYGPMDALEVPEHAPPLFVAVALDDQLVPPGDTFGVVNAWRQAKRPVEFHAYQKGGHGFGTGVPGTTTSLIMPQFEAWLSMQGFLEPR